MGHGERRETEKGEGSRRGRVRRRRIYIEKGREKMGRMSIQDHRPQLCYPDQTTPTTSPTPTSGGHTGPDSPP